MDDPRVRFLNDDPVCAGQFVLYWMQASQRTEFNHALEYAAARTNELDVPLVVGFGLMDDYPEANARHYAFMLEGLRDVAVSLRKRGVHFVVRRGSPEKIAIQLSKHAALVVCDCGYQRHQKRWRDAVADQAGRRVLQVESDVVVPVEAASDKQEYAARTIRPRIHRRLDEFLKPVKRVKVRRTSLALRIASTIDVMNPQAALLKLKVDRSVDPSPKFIGGQVEARKRFTRFLKTNLAGYHERRNEPSAAATSAMSGYLHFGQVSPLDLALQVMASGAPAVDRESYLEELIVRRELSTNFVNYCDQYDRYESLPSWARKTLASHQKDKRPYVYSRAELETAQTHDPYWNAAQMEMVKTGFMHNYMRMYWGKKILEWKRKPQEAYADTLYLNNKYFLCGRDPNAYGNVAWIFGLHDRPWGPARKIFGTVRYMNSAGLERKFDMDAYVRYVDQLAQ